MKYLLKKLFLLLSVSFLIGCQNETPYEIKNGNVYYKWVNGGNFKTEYKLIPDADPASFEMIEAKLKVDLAKDAHHVYVGSMNIQGANPSAFKQIEDYYWADNHHVYLLSTSDQQYHVITGAVPTSFSVLSHHWSKDAQNIFYMQTKLPDAAVSSFQPINSHWAKDNRYYYYHQFRLDSLDYHSAEIINDYYIKDMDNVFYTYKKLQGANANTFQPTTIDYFGHDGTYMFQWEKNKGEITDELTKKYIN